MLRDVLESKGLSVYKVAKDTNISYSTLNDIVIEKTDIKKTSAEMLYRLSQYLDISMEGLYTINDDDTDRIYIHNIKRNIIVETKNLRYQYLGPKNLISFRQIKKVEANVVYVDAIFMDAENGFVAEEDYIDLMDVLGEDNHILNYNYTVHIGSCKKLKKENLIDEAMMVSDNLSIKMYFMPDNIEPMVEVRSLSRMKNKAIIRLNDLSIIETNMSETMQIRALNAVKRNLQLINDERVVMYSYA